MGLGFDDGEVVAINDMRPHAAGGLDEVIEVVAQLRCSARDVHRGWEMLPDPCADTPRRGVIHHLGAERTGIDAVVRASLVALAADIDLQRLKRAARERHVVLSNFLLKAIHEEG